MRILFLATWFPFPADNGSKLRVHYLLRGLAARHEVTLLSFAFGTARPDMPGDLQNWCQGIQSVPLNPFDVNRAGSARTFLSARPVASRPIAAMSQLVSETICASNFDAVVASTEMTAEYALLAGAGTAKILEEHNSMTRWMRERGERANSALQRARYWASWQKRRRFEAGCYAQFDLVTMVSEQDRAVTMATVGRAGPPVEVVPNGVDVVHNCPGTAAPIEGSLVYSGSLTYSANYDAVGWFLDTIYPEIKRERPHISFTVTGSTRGVDMKGLMLDDSVTLTGYVDDVRIPVCEAMVCVVPIRQGGGTRLKILEAMALGTPVVSTSKGAEGLAVVDGVHILLADDPQSFARCTVRLLQDVELRRQLAGNARRLVEERYDWSKIGQVFGSLVEVAASEKEQQRRVTRA